MKINHFSKWIFMILLVGLSWNLNAAVLLNDSVPIAFDENAEYYYAIQKGIGSILENRSREGVALLNQGLTMKNKADNKNRIFGSYEMEFCSLVSAMNDDKLSSAEFDLGVAFLKEILLSDKTKIGSGFVSKLEAFLKENPKSVFALRLEIYGMDSNNPLVEKKLEHLLKLEPDLPGIDVYLGRIKYFQHNYSEAISYFVNAIHSFPEYALGYHFLGLCFWEKGDLVTAETHFDKAIELYPAYTDVYNSRGRLKFQMNDKEGALADFRKANNLNPNTEWPYHNMGLVFFTKNIMDSALYYFQEALDVNPNFVPAMEGMGRVYFNRQDYGEAIRYFTKCITLSPNNPLYFNERGDVYFADDNKDEALADYRKALEFDNYNRYALMRVGDFYQNDKNYIKALEYYDKVIVADPNFIYGYVSRALCYNSLNKNDQAKDALLKAVKLDSTYSPALGNLGWIYYCIGNYEKCISYSYRAIRFDEKAYYAMFNIALATLREGKFEESKTLYKKFIQLSKTNGDNTLSGAIDDLNDLIKKHIKEDQAKYIINNLFGKTN